MQSAPDPAEHCVASTVMDMATSAGSNRLIAMRREPSTNSPLDALSETVSVIRMSQPRMRLSTISSAATA